MSAQYPKKPVQPKPSPAKGNVVIGLTAAGILAGLLATSESSNRFIPVPYYDQAGVLTVCDGLTGAWINKNHRYTQVECTQRKRDYLAAMSVKMGQCVGPLTDDQWIAWGHFTYNIGTTAFCNSTAAKHLKAGNHRAACAQMLKWTWITKPGIGRVNCRISANKCKGIADRRDMEYKMCMRAAP